MHPFYRVNFRPPMQIFRKLTASARPQRLACDPEGRGFIPSVNELQIIPLPLALPHPRKLSFWSAPEFPRM